MERPLVVILLPGALEAFALRERAEELLASPAVAAVEPGRVGYGRLLGLPTPLGRRMTGRVARRLRLPGLPRAVLMFEPFQLPLAAALVDRHAGAELWYAPLGPPGRDAGLHDAALERAALLLDAALDAGTIRRRMAAIGIPAA